MIALRFPSVRSRIEAKAFIIIATTVVVLLLLLLVASTTVVIGSFEQLEREATLQNMERVESGYAKELSDLDAINRDWAAWDDTYQFVEDENPEYAGANIVNETMVNLRLDAMLFVNSSGDLVYSLGFDPDLREQVDIPQDLINATGAGHLIFETTASENSVDGLIQLESGCMLISAGPILRSDLSGPPRGTLLMGRWLDNPETQVIAGMAHLNLTALPRDDPVIGSELGAEGLGQLDSTSTVVLALNPSTIAGYGEIKDIYGEPALVMRALMPRAIYQQGLASEGYLILALAAASIALCSVMIITLNRSILSRLRKLNHQVSAIGSGQTEEQKVEVKGEDEISNLSRSINGMLRTINLANQQLADSEKRYRGVVEVQTDVIGRFGPDLMITFVNEAACVYFGASRTEMIGRRPLNIMPPEDAEHFQATLRSLTAESPIGGLEHRANTPTGSRWLRATARAILDQDGNVKEYQVVGKDITEERRQREELKKYQDRLEELVKERTLELDRANKDLEEEIRERRRAERNLVESERRYRAVVEDQTELIFRTTLDGHPTFTNTAFTKSFGRLTRGDGISIYSLGMPSEDSEKTLNCIHSLSKDLPFMTIQTRHVSADDETHHLLWTYRAILDREGKVVEVQGVGRDISDRIKMETELLRNQKLESIGLLAGGIAHDFNNVLTAIISNISLARMELLPESKGWRRLAEAEAAVMRARGLTNRLLTFSQGGAPVKEVTSLPELVRGAAESVLRGTNASAKYYFARDLKPVEIDRDQVGQVIGNLVQNCVDAMPEGGLVKLVARNEEVVPSERIPLRPGSYVKFSIQDSGCGIRRDHVPKIFDPFFTTKSNGAGLGLTMANSIVLKHQGYIDVESEENVGTTVSVYLPVADGIDEIEIKPVLAEENRSVSVLLMDDEASVLDVVSELLKHLGYEVDVAKDGQSALDKYLAASVASRPFDVVIMDLTIPEGMGGKEAIRKLLEIDPEAKAIVSSGYSNDPVMSAPSSYGFAGVLQKPYTMKNLDETLKAVMNHIS